MLCVGSLDTLTLVQHHNDSKTHVYLFIFSSYNNIDAVSFSSAYFGQGIVPIALDDVSCTGSESQLLSCSYDSNTVDCSHSEDAGARCQTGMSTHYIYSLSS